MLNTKIKSHDGKEFGAYLAKTRAPAVAGSVQGARTAEQGAPTIVMIQEIFGVNPGLVKQAELWCGKGYNVLVPDLFWRMEPGLELNAAVPAEKAKAFELYGKFDRQNGVKDLITTLAAARAIDGASGKAASMGFCLGGNMAFQMAIHSDADCNVVFYGGGMDKDLGSIDQVKKPLMMHFGGKDEMITAEVRAKIAAAIEGKPQMQMFVYDEAGHAFMRIGGETYVASAAALATTRTEEFLAKNLA